jgi:hypothetical protein
MKRLIERELGSLAFVSNQTATLKLPQDYSYARLNFRLVMRLYRAAGASAGAPKDLSGAQIIKRIDLRRNGREVLKSIDFETLMRLNHLRNGVQPAYSRKVYSSQADVTTQWDAYAAVTTGANAIDFDIQAFLDFAMWKSARPNDTLLDSTSRGGVSTLDLVITFGAYNDVMTAAYDPASGGVAADVAPTLYVSSHEYIDVSTADDPYTPYADNREYIIEKTLSANNSREVLAELGVGNLFRSFVIKTFSDDVLRNDILNGITLRAGTDVIKFRTAKGIRNENKSYCQLETMPTGYYLLEMCPDGHLAKALNTSNFSSLTLEGDVTKQGTICKIQIIPCELVAAARRL